MAATTTNPFHFLRTYASLILGIVLAALLLDLPFSLSSRDRDELELQTRFEPVFALLQQRVANLTEGAIRFTIATEVLDIGVPLQTFAISEIAGIEEQLSSSADGAIMVFYDSNDDAMLYQRIPSTDLLLALGPIPTVPAASSDTWWAIAYYLLVAFILFLWLWPLYRDLGRLRRAAVNFGKADFGTRVKLGNHSRILPVAQAFNGMAERLETLISSHKELTHAVSHELRTPLARFKFSLEMLARNLEPAKKQQYLDNMKGDVVELETLIDEMLSYARLSEENLLLNLVEVDLKQWLPQELQQYAHEAINVTCSFSAQPPPLPTRATCNPPLLARAIHNIIRNGLRYAQSSLTVHLHLTESQALIKICDDGPGIPADKRDTIFEPFSRLETSRDKQSGGYGLGLAIAARIMQRHRGSIHVDNCSPHGACFHLQWPRQ